MELLPGGLHEAAAEHITKKGLGLGSRILIAVVSGICGLFLLVAAPTTEKPVIGYITGGAFVVLCLTCATSGRVRQFFGSLIGSTLFLVSLWFAYERLGHPAAAGVALEDLLHVTGFFFGIGLPGLVYAVRVKFGFAASALGST